MGNGAQNDVLGQARGKLDQAMVPYGMFGNQPPSNQPTTGGTQGMQGAPGSVGSPTDPGGSVPGSGGTSGGGPPQAQAAVQPPVAAPLPAISNVDPNMFGGLPMVGSNPSGGNQTPPLNNQNNSAPGVNQGKLLGNNPFGF